MQEDDKTARGGISKKSVTDSPEQAKVINARQNANVLVVAGAGSGKTYTMTRRIINLIENGVAPEKILGLTFTRKAASELLGRVSAAVVENARTAEAEAVAAGIKRANVFLKPQVSTYDAFFQSIVRQYGLLVGFDPNTQPLSDAGAHQLAVTVIDENMDMLKGQEFGSFSDVVDKMLALSNAISGSMIGEGCASVPEAIERIRQWDQAFIAQMDVAIGDEEATEDEPKIGAVPKRRRKDNDEQYAERLAAYRASYHQLAVYRTAGLRDVARKRDILLTLVERYHERKQQLNMAEFNDFTVAAYALIARFPSIGERLRRRYTHVLLDEYQDTSTTQAALIAALFHPDCSDSDLTSGSSLEQATVSAVNAVGDPFQSIYAWRGASPGAFRMFERDFDMDESVKPYSLSVTRRNSQVVLEAANDLTQPLRVADRSRSSSLMREVEVPALSTVDGAKVGTVGVLGFDTLGQEIDAVARFAKASIARHTPSDSSQKDIRPHVAVLFRSKTNMSQFADGLQAAGLSTLTVGYSALLERPEIRDVLALLHVLADHADSGALMRLLATPRFGLGRKDLSALARYADRCNDEYRFRALVQAGLVPQDAKPEERGRLLADHRDQVPNMVFLADVLMNDDSLLDQSKLDDLFSASGAKAVAHAIRVLRQVGPVVNHSLVEVVETAIEALDLDVDTVVSQAVREPDKPPQPVLARMPMHALTDLVDTYTREITEGAIPTLRGFVAWVDSLSSVPDETASFRGDPVDVVLMTVHQSKGLEWDSVAVVGMKKGGFPSNQGDGLKIEADEEHVGGLQDGQWQAPQYRETAKTWLDDAAAVPVPVRADAEILPRFPHDMPVGGDPLAVLAELADVETVTNESEGLMRPVDGLGDGSEGSQNSSETSVSPIDDADAGYLSQQEEYGRRLHADERRLAYVALTRAREEVLMTYSRRADASRIPADTGSHNASKPSNFWDELRDALIYRDDVAVVDGGIAQTDGGAAVSEGNQGEMSMTPTLTDLGVAKPDGIFVGSAAQEYEQAVVEQAWHEPITENGQHDESLSWPAAMSDEMERRLERSAQQVRQMQKRFDAEVSDASVKDAGSGADNFVETVTSRLPEGESLAQRTRMLLADEDLMPSIGVVARDASPSGTQQNASGQNQVAGGDTLDDQVRRRGERFLVSRRQNVTSLQAHAGMMSERESREYWRGLVRPIPRVSSPAAQAGTRFHEWAQRFVDAYGEDPVSGVVGDDGISAVATDVEPETRASLLADLAAAEQRPKDARSSVERNILLWQRRLVEGRWAARRPYCAEEQIVVAIPELGGLIVNGKLDAVFYGGLDENDARKRFTVVDWKTGKKPTAQEDVEHKLVQLDMYRLMLSAMKGIPLDSVDATLYYLGIAAENQREIHARPKSKDEILDELKAGIPTWSDED
ncbi:DNA helicase-2/ATP-dependent DNA helicase PcrA [Bifidobacterium commune]|uniref:DNA 3'-5' helicase n=1 Tax=Bifidobacterium commune TaxID=1505727 RepID=A0A1C4GZC9_9BIFI|nr:ATP-dependent DNA helicase [Bifidobacterium commune]MBB2955299.1 DNA helicase-2/ATP-dependent DNA helicase PcrA [Bifidobacterium commune]SCC77979.1 DNA helicase-2 / ATP-dependent DNA helicase PcrA [Bifidobacterium commune]